MLSNLDRWTVIELFPAAVRASTSNGTGVDMLDYTGQMKLILDASAQGSGITNDVKLQDSADNSSFADVSPAVAFTQVGNTASLQTVHVNVDKLRRYVRAVATIGGGSSTGAYSVVGVVAKQQV
jgi:hypothetical protein